MPSSAESRAITHRQSAAASRIPLCRLVLLIFVSVPVPVLAEPGSAVGSMLVPLMGWSIPGYIVMQIYMLRTFRGAWRKAALAPLLLMIPLACYTLFALLAGSNLWPLLLLFLTPLAFLYLAGLGLAKLVVLRRA